MASLGQAKTLGGIGSLLIVLAIVPSAGPILGIVGFVLVLIAVRYIADIVHDNKIFTNMLVSTLLGIAGLVVALVVGIASFLAVFGGPAGFGPFPPGSSQPFDFFGPAFIGFLIAALVGLAIIWVFTIVSEIFLRRSFSAIAARINVGLFGTAALLYLIGAVLVIVLVGFIIIFVAAILQTVAFFSIPERPPQSTALPS